MRNGFGSALAERPIMASVSADMAVEVAAVTLMALRIAKATDHFDTGPREKAFARAAAPIAKYFNCSRVVAVANEATQCHGGNGFVEDGPMPRLYQEAPLNSVWDGAANMMCIDVAIEADTEAANVSGLREKRIPAIAVFQHGVANIDTMQLLLDAMVRDEFLALAAESGIAAAFATGSRRCVHETTPWRQHELLAHMFGTLGLV
jgi:putative acyl-CoA dehydrogenase